MSIHQRFVEAKKGFAVLVDPDNISQKEMEYIVQLAVEAGVNLGNVNVVELIGRTFTFSEYRWGMQGQEMDKEISGQGNSLVGFK